ncbi:alpha/beta hydrolase family protein [Siccibacter colletis]|uniref:alpha/beta hydrolase family protein n=1 Tax=Siccibacter colletis TaxID=1505757 RepID=UPI003CEA7C13
MFRIAILILSAALVSAAASADTGFHPLTLSEPPTRPLEVVVWYPTEQTGPSEEVGGNIAFVGTPVHRDAVPASGRHPVLLLSHGYGGNWRNLNWLAQAMVGQGYIVAAVDHPGTTTRNKQPAQAQALWSRPQDMVRMLDALIASPLLADRIDETRIAAAGHSLGGWTVMSLAGGQFSTARFITDCRQHSALGGCKLTRTLGIDRPEAAERFAASQHDARIKAVISLDLGLARGFTPQSLAGINVPVLIMSAGADSDDVPAALESGYLTENLPAGLTRSVSVTGATHFSFMQLCKPGAAALIEAEAPGEGVVCRDGGDISRATIHQRLVAETGAFLNQALHYQAPRGDTPLGSSR